MKRNKVNVQTSLDIHRKKKNDDVNGLQNAALFQCVLLNTQVISFNFKNYWWFGSYKKIKINSVENTTIYLIKINVYFSCVKKHLK